MEEFRACFLEAKPKTKPADEASQGGCETYLTGGLKPFLRETKTEWRRSSSFVGEDLQAQGSQEWRSHGETTLESSRALAYGMDIDACSKLTQTLS